MNSVAVKALNYIPECNSSQATWAGRVVATPVICRYLYHKRRECLLTHILIIFCEKEKTSVLPIDKHFCAECRSVQTYLQV
jgi:hypothetical protein